MSRIIPGVLTNDENDYVSRLKKAEGVASLVQVDVIDGLFAPNKTIGVEVIKRHPAACHLEVQLMVKEPEDYIKELGNLTFVSQIIFPYETKNVSKNIDLVKSLAKQVGLSINPQTAVSKVFALTGKIDILCIFSASPGFSGKKLENSVYGRIKESKNLYRNLAIEVDIGVNLETAPKLAAAGADFLVATSALYNAQDYQEAYKKLAEASSVER